jgi:hypothetical protein
MAGVACPMMRDSRPDGRRFLLGLIVGSLIGGVIVSALAYSAGMITQAALPHSVRMDLLIGLCTALGLADLTNRTPHIWRQVPQALIRHLPPGRVGLAWGIDIGLIATTQKVTSLLWAALSAFILLYSQWALAFGMTVGVTFSLAVASRTWLREGEHFGFLKWSAEWQNWVRAASGLALLMSALALQ